MMKETIGVQGMTCMNCVKSVEGSVDQLEGVKKVKVSLDDAHVKVSFNDSKISLDQIKEMIEEQGYEVN